MTVISGLRIERKSTPSMKLPIASALKSHSGFTDQFLQPLE